MRIRVYATGLKFCGQDLGFVLGIWRFGVGTSHLGP